MDDGYAERLARLKERPGYIILGRGRGKNTYVGYVENSFSMSVDEQHTNFFWSGTAYSNFGSKHELDGKVTCEEHLEALRRNHPETEWEAWDVHDPVLPVTLNYERMARGLEPSKTLSGVRNKWDGRNFEFHMKEDSDAGEIHRSDERPEELG